MIARGTQVFTRRGYVLVEDIEGEDFPVPHPQRGFVFIQCGEAEAVQDSRILIMLQDGRDLIVAPDLGLFTDNGTLLHARDILPGVHLSGPRPGVVEGVAEDQGTTYKIPGMKGVPFVIEGVSVMG